MRRIFLLVCVLTLTFACCDKDKAQEEMEDLKQENTQSSIMGTWNTTSWHGVYYENDILRLDTTINAPYRDLSNIIEHLRFTDTLLFVKKVDEDEYEFNKYLYKNEIVYGIIEGDTGAILTVSRHTKSGLDFYIEQKETDNEGTHHHIATYKSVRK
jgi:hypothetical protein